MAFTDGLITEWKLSGVSLKHLKRLLEQVQQLKSPIFVENSQIGQTSLDIAILGIFQEQNNSF